MKKKSCLFAGCLLLGKLLCAQVALREDEHSVTLLNDFIAVSFNKSNADLTAIQTKSGKDLLGKNGRGYLLGPGFSMSPSTFSVVRQTDDLVEIAFYHEADNHFQYDLHYVLRKEVKGIYCFLVQSHRAGDSAGIFGQTRWGIRGDEKNFDYHLVRDTIQGPMPKMAELKKENEIQDWTFTMEDGTVYTKYNYADYIEGRHVHGMAGQKSGLGLFVIQASHEYLNGGPTKQYQNVHSNPYLICMFSCGHFLSDIRKSDNRISDAWVKLNGPFLLYVNEAGKIDDLWKDAKEQSESEIAQWPYTWMQHKEYPLQRGTVSGVLRVNNKAAASAHVILAAGGYDWQAQTRGYIYSAQTNEDGKFTLEHVRPGTYTLYAYGANLTNEFKKQINVDADAVNIVGVLDWTPPAHGTKLWQIGIADRTTKGFTFSDHKRDYGVFNEVPANIAFTIGKSNEKTDWYYAQTKPGSWIIEFEIEKQLNGKATLTLAIAGAAKNPLLNVLLNGEKIGSYRLGNDASVYRSAILGGYYQQKEIGFPASKLKPGKNNITLSLPDVKPGGGVMYDAIKLEAGE